MITTRRALFALTLGGLVAAAAPAFAEIIIQERLMPALKVEMIPERPHPGWSWMKGHWRYTPEGWNWVSGRWIEHSVPAMPELIVETPPPPPSPRHFWVRGHWIWSYDHWQFTHGHWVI